MHFFVMFFKFYLFISNQGGSISHWRHLLSQRSVNEIYVKWVLHIFDTLKYNFVDGFLFHLYICHNKGRWVPSFTLLATLMYCLGIVPYMYHKHMKYVKLVSRTMWLYSILFYFLVDASYLVVHHLLRECINIVI